jgi:L-ascorbate metabolism protein UlaG (beta-lactamase superfamily)
MTAPDNLTAEQEAEELQAELDRDGVPWKVFVVESGETHFRAERRGTLTPSLGACRSWSDHGAKL